MNLNLSSKGGISLTKGKENERNRRRTISSFREILPDQFARVFVCGSGGRRKFSCREAYAVKVYNIIALDSKRKNHVR
jgi:hypothetical protein